MTNEELDLAIARRETEKQQQEEEKRVNALLMDVLVKVAQRLINDPDAKSSYLSWSCNDLLGILTFRRILPDGSLETIPGMPPALARVVAAYDRAEEYELARMAERIEAKIPKPKSTAPQRGPGNGVPCTKCETKPGRNILDWSPPAVTS